MEKMEFTTHPGDRVQIKSEMTDMYPMARVYMEGTVKEQRYDDLGYPMIWVEWDKMHWAYNGERDGWTLESHFNLIKEDEPVEDKQFDLEALAKALAPYMNNDAVEGNSDAEERAEVEAKRDFADEMVKLYSEKLKKGVEAAEEGSAFLIISAVKREGEGIDAWIPVAYSAFTDESGMVLVEMALAEFVASAHVRSALKEMEDLQRHDH